MASRFPPKLVQASNFLVKNGGTYYKQMVEQNKHHVQGPPTIEKCQTLAKQLFYTRLARFCPCSFFIFLNQCKFLVLISQLSVVLVPPSLWSWIGFRNAHWIQSCTNFSKIVRLWFWVTTFHDYKVVQLCVFFWYEMWLTKKHLAKTGVLKLINDNCRTMTVCVRRCCIISSLKIQHQYISW